MSPYSKSKPSSVQSFKSPVGPIAFTSHVPATIDPIVPIQTTANIRQKISPRTSKRLFTFSPLCVAPEAVL